MGWPKGRPRPKKVNSVQDERVPEQIVESFAQSENEEFQPAAGAEQEIPSGWVKGNLLNVRNFGDCYRITLHGEEYAPEREERSMRFTNLGECQDFISAWYATVGYNPLAR